jgi:tetratricopeptide (TPR) repeat protein
LNNKSIVILFTFVILLLTNINFGQNINFFKAESLFVQKNYKDAIKNFESVIKQSSNYEPAWFGLQNTYIQMGDLISAQKIKNIYLSDRLLWGEARIYFYSIKFDSSTLYIVELARRFPQSNLLNDALELGIIIAEAGKDSINLSKYSQALYYYETGNYIEGISIIQALITKSNTIAQYGYLLLSRIFKAEGEINQSIATLDEFNKKYPESPLQPKAQYNLGLIYLESLHDTNMAKNIFEDLIGNFPQSPESYFARSQLTIIESKSSPKQTSAPK